MLNFGKKAEILSLLEGRVTKSKVLPQLSFSVSDLLQDPKAIYASINARFNVPLIVRSSAVAEDSSLESQAGKYLSVPNVMPVDVIAAMERVRASFVDDNLDNVIFVQPMLRDIAMSGVLFSIDPNTGGNYFVINYDRSGSANSVTSGAGRNLHTCYVFHGFGSGDAFIDQVIEAARELMVLFNNDAIDIEFAFTSSGDLYLLQGRPLVVAMPLADFTIQKDALSRIEQFVRREMRPQPVARGQRAIYGIMPDWNPAEMIGTRPKPLALSLYRRLITDRTWAEQRYNYGYRDLRGTPLMVDFGGLPYIDVRASFNSFTPLDLSDELADQLINYYLDTLAAQPGKHDKIEFDIAFSCYTFDLHHRLEALMQHGFRAPDLIPLQNSLISLTNKIMGAADGLWRGDVKRLEQLEERRRAVADSGMDLVKQIYWLIEDCASYGTLPFAGLARSGFIAVHLLKSLVATGIFSPNDYENFIAHLDTAGSEMAGDKAALITGDFLMRYGHLRPGAYDITSLRYDDARSQYFSRRTDHPVSPEERASGPFSLSAEQGDRINARMRADGLNGDARTLVAFIKAGIEWRERAKFAFTRNLSDALELLAQLGAAHGFTRQDMAFADIAVVNRLYSSADDPRHLLESSIADGHTKHVRTLTCALPPVIVAPEDVYTFHLPAGEPNYITLNEAMGDICTDCSGNSELAGKIVMISAADPGFDWIFLHGIRGFITAYGGANSHMAIRAGQLGIPAIIGVGERLFAVWAKARTLHMDCANRKVEIIA